MTLKKIAHLCPKCKFIIPNIYNGVPFPCPNLRGVAPCRYGFVWLRLREQELKESNVYKKVYINR